MLKITVKKDQASSTLMLEGKLAGPMGSGATKVRAGCGSGRPRNKFSLDLNEVTFVDADGKALLTKLHGEGAKLISKGCLIRSIIARICGEPYDALTHQK